jgi:ubiquinone/menaquinone biosynthesis C-methylase UbiE
MSVAIDPEALKQVARAAWDRAAPGWNAQAPAIRTWLHQATEAMIAMASVKPGDRVLDVAAGAGDQTLDIAARVGPAGSVLATDISPDILALARSNAASKGYANIETLVGDGESVTLPHASFDAAVSRLGLMLFPQPLQSLQRIHGALKPGARLCTVVFSRPECNPCVTAVISTALRHAGLPPRDPYQPGSLFSLGRTGLMDELFTLAGFASVATTRLAAPFRLPSARDYLAFIRSAATPVQQILGTLDETRRAAAWEETEERLREFENAEGFEGPNELLLTAGRR